MAVERAHARRCSISPARRGRGRDRRRRGGRGADEHLRPRRPQRPRHVRPRRGVAAGAARGRAARSAGGRRRAAARLDEGRRRTCSGSSSRRRRRGRSRRSSSGSRRPIRSTLKLHLFGYYGSAFSHLAAPEMIERAAGGDAEAHRDVPRRRSPSTRTSRRSTAGLLELGADAVKDAAGRAAPALVRARSSCRNSEEWREAAERDAESKRALAATHSPEQLVELATRGYQYTPAPGDPHARSLPELVDAPLGDPLGAQEHEDLLLPDRRDRRGGHLAGRGGARLQGARRRGAPEAPAAPQRRPAQAHARRRRSSASRSRPRTTTSRSSARPASSRSATRTRTSTASAASCLRPATC